MCRKISDGIIAFRRGVDDRLRVMGEAGEVGAVLFAEERLDMFPFFGIVKL